MSIAYSYDGGLYLAVTRRCTLTCTFCPKTNGRWTVAGNDMSGDGEPTVEEVKSAAEAQGLASFKNVAFVGLGEPTMRLDLIQELGCWLRAKGHHVRLVTDGLASLRIGKDVSAELKSAVDEVHVSINAPDGESYAEICPNPYGSQAHEAACAFVRALRSQDIDVKVTVVALPQIDIKACERLASSLSVPLRVRPYFEPSSGEPHERAIRPSSPA